MATIVVTGASGFLGAHYLKYASERHQDWELIAQVRSTKLGLSLPNVRPLSCDLTRKNAVEALSQLKPKAIVHMASAIMESDVLIHESTFLKELEKRAKQTYHSTAEQAAKVAKKTKAKKLYLFHLSSRHKENEKFEVEARTVFSEAFTAKDLMKISV